MSRGPPLFASSLWSLEKLPASVPGKAAPPIGFSGNGHPVASPLGMCSSAASSLSAIPGSFVLKSTATSPERGNGHLTPPPTRPQLAVIGSATSATRSSSSTVLCARTVTPPRPRQLGSYESPPRSGLKEAYEASSASAPRSPGFGTHVFTDVYQKAHHQSVETDLEKRVLFLEVDVKGQQMSIGDLHGKLSLMEERLADRCWNKSTGSVAEAPGDLDSIHSMIAHEKDRFQSSLSIQSDAFMHEVHGFMRQAEERLRSLSRRHDLDAAFDDIHAKLQKAEERVEALSFAHGLSEKNVADFQAEHDGRAKETERVAGRVHMSLQIHEAELRRVQASVSSMAQGINDSQGGKPSRQHVEHQRQIGSQSDVPDELAMLLDALRRNFGVFQVSFAESQSSLETRMDSLDVLQKKAEVRGAQLEALLCNCFSVFKDMTGGLSSDIASLCDQHGALSALSVGGVHVKDSQKMVWELNKQLWTLQAKMTDFQFCLDTIINDVDQPSRERTKDMQHLQELLSWEISRVLQAIESHRDEVMQTSVPGSILRVKIFGASNLHSPHWLGKSSYSCTCEIPWRNESTVATPVISNTTSPEWNQVFTVTGYVPGDNLAFTVFAHQSDCFPNLKLVGRAEVASARFAASDFESELVLAGCEDINSATLRVHVKTEYVSFMSMVRGKLNALAASYARVVQAPQDSYQQLHFTDDVHDFKCKLAAYSEAMAGQI